MAKQPNPQIDEFMQNGCMRCPKGGTPACKVHQWTPILETLRQLLLETELEETRKWGVPTYTLKGKNVVMLGVFNDSCVISFLKGSLLKDQTGILEFAGPNSREGKIIRFTDISQVQRWEKTIRALVKQAIQLEKQGKKVPAKPGSAMEIPEELIEKFQEHDRLEEAFFALTPGRQRGYLIHFIGAKQASTRRNRIEKCIPKIFAGKGMMD